MANTQVEVPEVTECSKPTRWTEDKSFCVGSCFHRTDLGNDIKLLDPQKYTSVSEALAALNSQTVDSQEFRMVFSKRRHAFYVLWPSDTSENKVEQFLADFNNSVARRTSLKQQKDDPSPLNQVQKDGHSSPSPSVFSGASTTDTAHDDTSVPAVKDNPVASSLAMIVEDLNLDQNEFDPCESDVGTEILKKMDCPAGASIQKLHDNPGSFNDGVWLVSDSAFDGLVLKLVPHYRVDEARKTDTEKYIELVQTCPDIVSDLSVTFPVKIFQLRGPSGDRCKDLIVMRKAPGLQITQHLFQKCIGPQAADLQSMFKDFGTFLQKFHQKYGHGTTSMQHGDCQPSNVFYDEVSGLFTLIDVADFGFGPFLAQGGEDDVEHFVEGLYCLKEWYGRILLDTCAQTFREGYSRD